MTHRSQPEAAEQRALAQWLDLTGALWCHPPNGGARDARTGAELKRQGVKRGVPDALIFDVPPGLRFVGVAVELKAGRAARPSPWQERWHERLRRAGWLVIVAHSASEAIQTLIDIGYSTRGWCTDRSEVAPSSGCSV
jgi:hypothetical protein